MNQTTELRHKITIKALVGAFLLTATASVAQSVSATEVVVSTPTAADPKSMLSAADQKSLSDQLSALQNSQDPKVQSLLKLLQTPVGNEASIHATLSELGLVAPANDLQTQLLNGTTQPTPQQLMHLWDNVNSIKE